jgi:endo-1,3(4)-beta-glucanase
VRPVSVNIFQPIETGTPAPSIEFLGGHYVKKEHIVDGDVPIQTNKFYANFFLGSQSSAVWTHPYHLVWAQGRGETRSYGMAISHTERTQFAYGPSQDNPRYFISPIGIHHMVLTADELGNDTVLTVEELQAFSVYANLAPSSTKSVVMSLPCVQGMGMITAIYDDATPMIMSGVFFRSFKYIEEVSRGTYKWHTTLNDNSEWLVYVTPVASLGVPPFKLLNSSAIAGPTKFKGYIQVAKNPGGDAGEKTFDAAAGAYATNATITGTTNEGTGSYTLRWGKGGAQDKTLLMYALPHHVESFDQETKGALTNIQLVTTTKGNARAVLADRMTMLENDLPDTIGFAPWAKNVNGGTGGSENVALGASALALVNNAAHAELSQNFNEQTNLDSMYYSGKGLAKFASMLYTVSNIAGNRNLAASGLVKLKDSFNVFVNNTQQEPLVYDKVWKGVVSYATYRAPRFDPGLDFGNTLYNDHHFHYGYFVYTAAVIGFLDPKWLDQGSNKKWVNTLVRDYANPVDDEFFPFQRSFDWFHGHSWAKGLWESGDGKDQESTSEDTFATYALKMWGRIIRDPNMEARANLQLAVQARSLNNYFLMTSDNKNQPEKFVPNKVTGILFENKIDHTTYFGGNTEFVEGIHMIPLNPSSAYTRSKQFVQEEWDAYFSDGRVDKVQGGWKAILYANYALINPQKAYEFFADPEFDTPLDGGASRTWYLAYTASLMGAQTGMAESDALLDYDTAVNKTEVAGVKAEDWNDVYDGGAQAKGPEDNLESTTGADKTEAGDLQAEDETPANNGGAQEDELEQQQQEEEQQNNAASVQKGDGKWPVGFVWPTKSGATKTTPVPVKQDASPTPYKAPSEPQFSTPSPAASDDTTTTGASSKPDVNHMPWEHNDPQPESAAPADQEAYTPPWEEEQAPAEGTYTAPWEEEPSLAEEAYTPPWEESQTPAEQDIATQLRDWYNEAQDDDGSWADDADSNYPDMRWAMQDSDDVEGRDSDDESEYDWECDEDEGVYEGVEDGSWNE